ncbi:MAG TPA: ChaN family lipoprotein [Terriglobales bacterium]|jgi:hypothetical protein
MGPTISIRSKRPVHVAHHVLAPLRRAIARHDHIHRGAYVRRFRDAYAHPATPCSMEQVVTTARASDFVLLGDYHACPVYQEFATDLLRRIADPARTQALAIEFVLTRDQHVLDAWLAGEIGERELRARLRFDDEWGYAWRPYFQLLQAARQADWKLLAVDCRLRAHPGRIRTRDRHAAQVIAEFRSAHPGAQLLVVIGESHLAPEHLPLQLRAAQHSAKMCTVLQNLDDLHWSPSCIGAEAAALSGHAFCVFTATPFDKYQGYRTQLAQWRCPQRRARRSGATRVYDLIDAALSLLGVEQYADEDSEHEPRYLVDHYPEVMTAATTRYVVAENTLHISDHDESNTAVEACRFVWHACQRSAGKQLAVRIDYLYLLASEYALATCAAQLIFPVAEASHADLGRALLTRTEAIRAGRTLGSLLAQCFRAGLISRSALRNLFFRRSKDDARSLYLHLLARTDPLKHLRRAA